MEMIEVNNLVMYECPNCGYITKDKKGLRLECPKCDSKSKVWIQEYFDLKSYRKLTGH